MTYPLEDIEEVMRDYFTGEYLRKIKSFRKKIKEPIPEDYYYCIDSIVFDKPYISKTNNISNPTADRALRLIEIQEERKYLYQLYSSLQDKITSILEELNVNNADEILFRSFVGATHDSFKKTVNLFSNYSYSKSRIIMEKLLKNTEKLLNKEMEGMINNDNCFCGNEWR